jgi:predicted ABC-class ATPase
VTADDSDDGGIPHGGLLIRFTDAVWARDEVSLAGLRDEIAATMGDAALTDAAAVAALFNAIDRVADSTGIPLEDWKAEDTADFRAAIGVDGFHAAGEKGTRT